MSEFTEVERPEARGNLREPGPLTAALLKTLQTGKAISIPLNGHSYHNVQNGLRQRIRKHRDLRVRTRMVGDYVIAWLVRLES